MTSDRPEGRHRTLRAAFRDALDLLDIRPAGITLATHAPWSTATVGEITPWSDSPADMAADRPDRGAGPGDLPRAGPGRQRAPGSSSPSQATDQLAGLARPLGRGGFRPVQGALRCWPASRTWRRCADVYAFRGCGSDHRHRIVERTSVGSVSPGRLRVPLGYWGSVRRPP